MTPEQIIAIYCLCDDYLKSLESKKEEWCNRKMSDAEIMAVFIVATRFFYGNIERARIMLKSHGYFPKMLSKSQLNRRIHSICDEYWQGIIKFAHGFIPSLYPKDFIVDSFPVRVCHNIRIYRSRIFQGESFRGYNASKKEYFYGLKATVLTSVEGNPFQMILAPGSEHDLPALKLMNPFKLPKGTTIYGDAAYIDYDFEDLLKKSERNLIAERNMRPRQWMPDNGKAAVPRSGLHPA